MILLPLSPRSRTRWFLTPATIESCSLCRTWGYLAHDLVFACLPDIPDQEKKNILQAQMGHSCGALFEKLEDLDDTAVMNSMIGIFLRDEKDPRSMQELFDGMAVENQRRSLAIYPELVNDGEIVRSILEGRTSPDDGLKNMSPALRERCMEIFEEKKLEFSPSTQDPEALFSTVASAYENGALDDNPIGKQYAWEFLEAARKYAPDHFAADPAHGFRPPLYDRPNPDPYTQPAAPFILGPGGN